jgi:glycosyltransferase involved in cell wall biosynthesis
MKKISPMKIVFLIRSLDDGGAQRQIVYLSKGLAREGHNVTVCSFYAGGAFEGDLENSGVQVRALGKTSRWDLFLFLYTFIKFVLNEQPDILHSYLGTANVISTFSKLFRPSMRLVWGVRSSNTDLSKYDWFWRFSFFLEKKLSIFPNLIIANSVSGKEHSVKMGFPKKKIVVIPNGIDVKKFYPDPGERKRMREKWEATENEKIIGLVARLDPKKDHANFLKAAYLAINIMDEMKFLCVGRSDDKAYKEGLYLMSDKLGLGDHIMWMDSTNDMKAIYNGLDLLCLSSAYGEGFPNVLGEAMACGIPCIATDTGDSSRIIGKFGLIVPPRDTSALAKGILKMLEWIDKEKEDVTMSVRKHIIDNYGTEKLVSNSKAVLYEIYK